MTKNEKAPKMGHKATRAYDYSSLFTTIKSVLNLDSSSGDLTSDP